MEEQAVVIFVAGALFGGTIIGFISYMCLSAKNGNIADLEHDSQLAWRVAKSHHKVAKLRSADNGNIGDPRELRK